MGDSLIFRSLLERVGSSGKYQFILALILCSIGFQAGSISYNTVYLFHQDPYTCPPNIINCQEYVCALPQSQQTAFINPDFTSLSSRFSNYRCDNSDLQTASTIVYSAALVGQIITILLTGHVTIRQFLLAGIFLSILGTVLALTGTNIALASVGLFFVFGCRGFLVELSHAIIPEFITGPMRGRTHIILSLVFSFASVLVGLVFWLIHPWELAYSLFQLMPFIITAIVAVKYLQETIIEQASRFTIQESEQSLRRIARINKIDYAITQDELRRIRQEYLENEGNGKQHKFSVLDLFRFNSLRMTTLLSLVMQFFMSYQFNASQMVLADYQQNFYLNGSLLGLSHVISTAVLIPFANTCARRTGMVISQALSLVIAAILLVWMSCTEEGECGQSTKFMQTVALLIYRLLVTFAYDLFYLSQNEYFPSQVRSVAVLFTSTSMRLAVMIVPALQAWFESNNWSIFITFVASSIGMLVCVVFFPETLGVPPPQVIEELRQQKPREQCKQESNQAQQRNQVFNEGNK